MDNPTRWNITNSAQNIVSALIDPSKQFDHVFRREWSNTFSGFVRHKPSMRKKEDAELRTKLANYVDKLENRKYIKIYELQCKTKAQELENASRQRRDNIYIPEVFFMEDFDLSNLEIFGRVMSSMKFRKKTEPIAANDEHDVMYEDYDLQQLLSKSQLKELQQSFTDYLDTIEDKLSSQISNRSGDFFQVMSSVDSVMDELSLAIKSVSSLRRKCSALNDSLIMPNMKNIHLSKTRDNAQSVLDKMREISSLCKVQPMIQLLLSGSDYNGALELIAKSRVTLNRDMNGIVCLKHYESQLIEIERVIGAMIQHEFQTQLKFVNKFHEERKKRIESILDIEQWKMIEDVPKDFQQLLTLLVDEDLNISETFVADSQIDRQQQLSDAPSYINSTSARQHSRASSDTTVLAMNSEPNTNPNNINQDHLSKPQTNGSRGQLIVGLIQSSTTSTAKISSSTKQPRRFNNKISHVAVGGGTYVIVNSVMNLIRIMMEYCKCAVDIKSLSAEVLERLFNLLQLYNSKTYHLVYGAGAIQVAGLKTITTRSLVVAQRSLKLVILLIPAIYKHFSQLLPDDTRLRRFDEIRLSYEDHAAKILELVNSIVKDVIVLQLQEWEAKPPVPSQQFTAVTQHLSRLHDNIQDALPAGELRLLFMKINHTFKDVLITHLRRLNISNDAGPQQWLVKQELAFYKISLAKLSAFRGWESNCDDLWAQLE